MTFRDVPAGSQEIGFEKAIHEIERDHMMRDPMSLRVQFREGDLAGIVLRPVVE